MPSAGHGAADAARPTPAGGAGWSAEDKEAVGSAPLLWWGGTTANLPFPVHRIVCQTGEAQEVFSDVVTVNVSREGKSRERYSYVVSSCLLDVSLVILTLTFPAPFKTSLQPPVPLAGLEGGSMTKSVRVLEEQLT